MRPVVIPLLAAAIGCAPPPEAPEELSDLSRYLFREWGNEDPAVMEAGIRNLESFVGDLDLTAGRLDRSFSVNPLEEDDALEVVRPPSSTLSGCDPVSLAFPSRHAVDDHARMHIEPDQGPFEPTAPYYTREFLESEAPSCFVDRSCETLRTFNELARENDLMVVDLLLGKEFRWVSMVDDAGDPSGRWAIVARSWMPEMAFERNGGDVLIQSYAADVWMGRPDGTTWRYQALYSETDIQGVQDSFDMRGFLSGGIEDSMLAHDEGIDGLVAR